MIRRDEQRGDEVLPRVVAHLAERNLRSGDDHRLRQAVEHERQRRGRVGHRVGAVENEKAVVVVVVLGDVAGDLGPLGRSHVRRVEQRLVLVHQSGRHRSLPKLRHRFHLMLQISRLRVIAVAGVAHTDGSAGVRDVDALSHARSLMPAPSSAASREPSPARAGEGGAKRRVSGEITARPVTSRRESLCHRGNR